jgi:hypothetical protein
VFLFLLLLLSFELRRMPAAQDLALALLRNRRASPNTAQIRTLIFLANRAHRAIRKGAANTYPLNRQSNDPRSTDVRNKNATTNVGAPDFQQLKLLAVELYIDRNTRYVLAQTQSGRSFQVKPL